MAALFGLNESIECKSADVVALKIEGCIRALNHPLIGRCIKYLCSRNGHATIKKELNPKTSLLNNPNAKMDVGDYIHSTAFYVLVKGLKIEAVEFNGVYSGRHNCNAFTSKSDFTFAQISEPFPGKEAIVVELAENYMTPISALSKKRIE
jgi:hypothetical protein